jgi:type I phosphodiesterase/nucleotide pyrophosphatase
MRDAERKLILVVIDGLTPGVFERAVETRSAPALAFLAEHGEYGRAVSTFPSLTPVCLASIATGAHSDAHHIPHLAWYHRAERRIVEYGSSYAAMRAVGRRRVMRDAILAMNQEHLAADAPTVFEQLERAGLETAAVNFTCYRAGNRHRSTVPGVPAAYGPRRFFYFNLFESDRTGSPLAVRARGVGSVDAYASTVGRWLVTRDGFDFLVYYLPDYDFASHHYGPDATSDALARSDAAVGALIEAAGGGDEFLARYAVILCSDHGQTPVHRGLRLESSLAGFRLAPARGSADGAELAVTASNRVGMVYRLPACTAETRDLAARIEREPAVDAILFREDGEAVVRRGGEELRFAAEEDGWRTSGDPGLLSEPDAFGRVWAALANPNAGDLVVTAADGVEFADIGGRHHAGGGSHGSLAAGDSEVPMLTVGTGPAPPRIVDVVPLVRSYFGVAAATTARAA